MLNTIRKCSNRIAPLPARPSTSQSAHHYTASHLINTRWQLYRQVCNKVLRQVFRIGKCPILFARVASVPSIGSRRRSATELGLPGSCPTSGIRRQSFHYCTTSLEDYYRRRSGETTRSVKNRIINEFQIRRFVLALALSCVVDGMMPESLGSVGGLSQTDGPSIGMKRSTVPASAQTMLPGGCRCGVRSEIMRGCKSHLLSAPPTPKAFSLGMWSE